MTPRLIVITDTSLVRADVMLVRIERLLNDARPGTVMVQLRDKQVPIRERLALGSRLRDLTRVAGQALCVNDRVDLAVLLGADAVHLGEASVAPHDVRGRYGNRFWISVAQHDLTADPALPDIVDAELVSPICAERKGVDARGVTALSKRRDRVGKSTLLYALGGVTATHAADCIKYGADGVAAISAAIGSSDATPLLTALNIASC